MNFKKDIFFPEEDPTARFWCFGTPGDTPDGTGDPTQGYGNTDDPDEDDPNAGNLGDQPGGPTGGGWGGGGFSPAPPTPIEVNIKDKLTELELLELGLNYTPDLVMTEQNLDQLVEQLEETEDFGSKLAGWFGFKEDLEYNQEKDQFDINTEFDFFDMPAVDALVAMTPLAPLVAAKSVVDAFVNDRPAKGVLGLLGGLNSPALGALNQANSLANMVNMDLDSLNKAGALTSFEDLSEHTQNSFNQAIDDITSIPSDVESTVSELADDLMGLFDSTPDSTSPVSEPSAPVSTSAGSLPGPSETPSNLDDDVGGDAGDDYLRFLDAGKGGGVGPLPSSVMPVTPPPEASSSFSNFPIYSTVLNGPFDWTVPGENRRFFS